MSNNRIWLCHSVISPVFQHVMSSMLLFYLNPKSNWRIDLQVAEAWRMLVACHRHHCSQHCLAVTTNCTSTLPPFLSSTLSYPSTHEWFTWGKTTISWGHCDQGFIGMKFFGWWPMKESSCEPRLISRCCFYIIRNMIGRLYCNAICLAIMNTFIIFVCISKQVIESYISINICLGSMRLLGSRTLCV